MRGPGEKNSGLKHVSMQVPSLCLTRTLCRVRLLARQYPCVQASAAPYGGASASE